MLIKNQIYEAVISDYTSEGQGVAKIDGCAVFIPNAIFGEICRVRIEKAAKTWASGKIVELVQKSPHRVNRACPVAKIWTPYPFCPPPLARATATRPSTRCPAARAKPMQDFSVQAPMMWWKTNNA